MGLTGPTSLAVKGRGRMCAHTASFEVHGNLQRNWREGGQWSRCAKKRCGRIERRTGGVSSQSSPLNREAREAQGGQQGTLLWRAVATDGGPDEGKGVLCMFA